MKGKCDCCQKEAELEKIQDYWGGDMFLCPECFEEAQISADYEQERYKEEGGK